jgi:outer membrane protein insertion porin family
MTRSRPSWLALGCALLCYPALAQPERYEDVQAAIDKLFSTGEFEDIQVDVEPRDDGVAVRFITKNRTFIGHISVEGKISDPPNAGQILDATQLRLGQPLESKDLTESDTAVQDLFRRNGLYDATVSHRLVPEPQSQQMAIVFDVKSGKRARFDTPVISGDPKLPE